MAVTDAPSAPTTASSTNGSINTSIYVIICALYLWVDYTNKSATDDADASKNKMSNVFAFIFLIIIWLTQFFMTFFLLKQQCTTPNYGLAAWSSFATWFVLFVPLFWCLEYLYTWLQPFGNTFGYLFIKLNGLVSFMDSILRKDPGTDKIQKYLDYMREDPWALFSMLTTSDIAPDSVNASMKFDELKGSYLNDKLPSDAKSTFVNYVRIKETVAKLIFYILTLNLMADLTNIIALENSPCTINVDEESDAAVTKPTKPPTIYKTSE